MKIEQLPKDYAKTLWRAKQVFSWIGLEIFYDNCEKKFLVYLKYNWFYNLSATVLIVCIFGELEYLLSALQNFEHFLEVTALAPCLGFCLIGLSKMYAVSSNRDSIQQLVADVAQIWQERKSLTPAEMAIYDKYYKNLRWVNSGFYWLYSVLIFVFNFNALAELLVRWAIGLPYKYYLPYFISYPFDPTASVTVYVLVYIWQIWDGIIACCGIVGCDCLVVVMTSHLCMLFEILQQKILTNVEDKVILSADIKRVNAERIESLLKIIKMHQHLIRCASRLEKMFSIVILINFTGGSIIICLVGFQASAGLSMKEMLMHLLFLIASLVQVLMICWYGNILIEASQGISTAAYNSSWYLADTKYTKLMGFLILRSQRPCYLTAFKFSNVSLHSFTTVIRSSWSYFTLLRCIYNPTKNQLK